MTQCVERLCLALIKGTRHTDRAEIEWVTAHHLVHWVDGGHSDPGNAALLCQRHHTFVHDRRLIAALHPPAGSGRGDADGDADAGRSVTWDLSPGSYDRDLPARLTVIRRARARARLDTGPPDPAAHEPPEHVSQQWPTNGWPSTKPKAGT